VGTIDAGCAAGREFALGDTRACLRPDRCPYARSAATILGCPEIWSRALSALLPGDPDLALEIVGDLVDETADA
jgi:hypothetical protein